MSRLASAMRRLIQSLRLSMAAQISIAIAVISTVLIAASALTLERVFVGQLRAENEVILISNLAFVRDDLVAASTRHGGFDSNVVTRVEGRVHRLRAALYDDTGRQLARSATFPFTVAGPPPGAVVDVEQLTRGMTVMQIEDELQDRYGPMTEIAIASDGTRYRTLVGRVRMPATAGARPESLLVALAIETTSMPLVLRDRHDLVLALVAALLTAVLVGTLIARRIVAGAKRLGVAAGRIGAQALGERLSLDETPTELVASTTAFNGMLDRLQRSFDRLSAFSSDLAHDLRTPINNLLGEAQVALSRPRSNDDYRAVIESSVEEYERLSRMIGNMLFLARADNAEAVVSSTWIDIRDVLDRVVSYFELIAEEHRVRLVVDAVADGSTPLRVCADEDMLVRALSNLVSNALRHATAGTEVGITAHVDAATGCTISVSNIGPAIPAEMQPRIFERFYRGVASRENSSSSSGLGLAIVRSIMDLHHGTVAVRSGEGSPTVFTLVFPPRSEPASAR